MYTIAEIDIEKCLASGLFSGRQQAINYLLDLEKRKAEAQVSSDQPTYTITETAILKKENIPKWLRNERIDKQSK